MAKSQPVLSFYDLPMWASIERRRLELQRCADCKAFRFPPGPICAECLSMEAEWTPVGGRGEILSWVVFHRQYFDDHPPPYNAVAVRLDEGPIIVSNLIGEEPEGSWIGRRVEIVYRDHEDRIQHAVRLAAAAEET